LFVGTARENQSRVGDSLSDSRVRFRQRGVYLGGKGAAGLDETTRTLLDFVDSHGRRLHALFAKLTANQDGADDLLQDFFVRILRTTSAAAAPRPEAYLYRAAINLAFDWRKRNPRTPNFKSLSDDVATHDIAPLDRMVQRECVEHVLAAMDRLSEQDRELISLRFLQGESPEWISDRWGSTPHQIRSRCSKAVARLRKIVERDRPVQKARQT
jgi:RNA polymerase sigma-70 factor (ECF subfamily)